MPASSWKFAHIVRNRALCPPAMRMLVLSGWATEEEEGCSLLPVLAIEICTMESYRTMKDEPPSTNMDNRTLEGHGYHYAETMEVSAPVVFHEGQIIPLLHPTGEFDFGCYETVLCDWPKEQDETKLADTIGKLTADARKAFERRRASDTPGESS